MDVNTKEFQILSLIAFALLGLQIIWKVLPWLYFNIIGPMFCGKVEMQRLGAWAVITGATDGIGKAYAKALAQKGLNLVLISRSLSKLETVKSEIGAIAEVEIKIVDVDFTDGPEIYEKIAKCVQNLDVGILINNVGISYSHPEYFIQLYKDDPKFLQDIVAANIHSVTHMTALILPQMVSKNKGVIINISSASAVIPSPLLTVYGASKTFVDKFSNDLQTEYASQGIIVQSVLPGFVATNMSRMRKTSLFVPSPDTYVASALKTVGIAGHSNGYLPHALIQLTVKTMCAILGNEITSKIVFNNILGIRKRALSKKN